MRSLSPHRAGARRFGRRQQGLCDESRVDERLSLRGRAPVEIIRAFGVEAVGQSFAASVAEPFSHLSFVRCVDG